MSKYDQIKKKIKRGRIIELNYDGKREHLKISLEIPPQKEAKRVHNILLNPLEKEYIIFPNPSFSRTENLGLFDLLIEELTKQKKDPYWGPKALEARRSYDAGRKYDPRAICW